MGSFFGKKFFSKYFTPKFFGPIRGTVVVPEEVPPLVGYTGPRGLPDYSIRVEPLYLSAVGINYTQSKIDVSVYPVLSAISDMANLSRLSTSIGVPLAAESDNEAGYLVEITVDKKSLRSRHNAMMFEMAA